MLLPGSYDHAPARAVAVHDISIKFLNNYVINRQQEESLSLVEANGNRRWLEAG
jgi:hypothetical protein